MSFLFSRSVCLCLIFLLLSSQYWFNEQPQAHTVRPHANAYEYQKPKVFVCGISLSQYLFLSLSLWHTHTHTHAPPMNRSHPRKPSTDISWTVCVCSCGGKAVQGLGVQSHITNFYCGSMTCYWTVNYLKTVYMKSSKLQCCHDDGHFFNLKINSSCTNNRSTVNPVFLKRYYNRELSKAKTKSKKLWSC